MSEKELLEKNVSGITKLEIILIAKGTPECDWFINTESIDIICKYKRFDMLEFSTPITLLLKHKTINQTYLGYILECYKNGDRVNIESFCPDLYSSNLDAISEYYITFAEYDLIEYIPELTKEDLFRKKNGKRLIEILLDKNRKLTIDKILSNRIKRDVDIAVYLKLKNVKQKEIDLPTKNDNFIKNYIEEYNKSLPSVNIDDESKAMLDTVKSFLLDDEKSSEELVNLLLKSYEVLIANNYPYASKELEQLAFMKLNNNEFRLIKGKFNCFYNGRNEIIMTDNIMSTINHEMGHAFFHLLSNEEVPSWFKEVKEKITNDKNTLIKIDELSKKYKKISDSILRRIDKYYNDYFDMDDKEIEEYLETEREKLIERYKRNNLLKEEDIKLLFNCKFSVEHYKREHKRIKTREMKDAILRCEYGHITAVNDIVDAIYEGKFWDSKLTLENGEEIESCSGHGIYYYLSESNQFDEIIAEYSQLIKTPKAKEGLDLLEYILGSEFVNNLKEYYEKEIVNSRRYKEEVKLCK